MLTTACTTCLVILLNHGNRRGLSAPSFLAVFLVTVAALGLLCGLIVWWSESRRRD